MAYWRGPISEDARRRGDLWFSAMSHVRVWLAWHVSTRTLANGHLGNFFAGYGFLRVGYQSAQAQFLYVLPASLCMSPPLGSLLEPGGSVGA